MASDLNERQKIIKELNKNLLVSASAGSGKTTILVERMVALVEQGNVRLSSMAAITFTKKAAGEFYERFYRKLSIRSRDDFNKKVHDQYSLLEEPTKEDKIRDKEALSNIDTCFFGTIDAFYQKILNEHPFEAGLSSSAKIVDDEELNIFLLHKFNEYVKSDNKKIREEAEFFSSLVGAKPFVELMSKALSHNELEIYQIPYTFDLLKKGYSELLKSYKSGMTALLNNETTFKYISKGKSESAKSKEWWSALKQNIRVIQNLKDDDYRTGKTIFSKFKDMRINKDDQGLLLGDNFASTFVEERFSEKTGNSAGFFINNAITDQLNKIIFFKAIEFISNVKNEIYSQMLKEGILTFSMATDCLLKLLRNEDEYKNTITQIRSKIDALLIDECQDTDIKQYEIFFRLAASDFNSDFSKLTIEGGKLYACGDRKQGIYHFRGADVSTYDYIKDIFEEKKKCGLPFDLVLLTDNYRSKGKLKRYFNDTFKQVLEVQGYDPILNDGIENDGNKFGAFTYDTDKENEPENVANLILDFVNNRGYNFKDFMVITASRDKISNYSKVFAEKSIPYYGEGNIDIHVSSLLDVVIGLFKYIGSGKKDLISYYELLSSPLFGFNITNSISENVDYFDFINKKVFAQKWPSIVLENLAAEPLIIKCLGTTGIDILVGFIHLLKDMENCGDIQNFDDAIKYFTDLQNCNLEVERLSLLANNIDAVQIANAHKTKGLEKKVVILTKASKTPPSVSEIYDDKFYLIDYSLKNGKYGIPLLKNPYIKIPPISDLIENEKAYLEEEVKRLLYVAGTRAGEYLLIANPKKKDNARDTQNKWYPLMCGLPVNAPDIKLGNTSCNIDEENFSEYKNDSYNKYNKSSKEFKIVKPSSNSDEDFSLNQNSDLERNDALIYGSMVHKLMEYIVKAKNTILDEGISKKICNDFGRQDLYERLDKVRKTVYTGGFKQPFDEISNIVELVKKYNAFTEVPFSFKDGKNIVSGSIDLVIERENDILIIDYKTDVHDVDHQSQLSLYKQAISKITKTNKIIKPFIYLVR